MSSINRRKYKLPQYIKMANNLEELKQGLDKAKARDTYVNTDSLPTFGAYPGDTQGIYSWDTRSENKEEHKFLAQDCNGQWEVVAGKAACAHGY